MIRKPICFSVLAKGEGTTLLPSTASSAGIDGATMRTPCAQPVEELELLRVARDGLAVRVAEHETLGAEVDQGHGLRTTRVWRSQ